jgi:hypothetical protein
MDKKFLQLKYWEISMPESSVEVDLQPQCYLKDVAQKLEFIMLKSHTRLYNEIDSKKYFFSLRFLLYI